MRPEPSRTGTGAAHRAPLPLAWWGGHGDRLLFILHPPAPVRDAVIQSLEHAGMLDLLGDHWPVECWHQRVSARYEDTPEIRQRLLQAGARVQADAFRIELDRVRVTADGHAQFCAHRRHRPLEQLVSRLGQALVAEGLPALYGHAPHIVLNHACDGPPQPGRPAPPVPWQAGAFELVRGGGDPYRYTLLARWPLAPARAGQFRFLPEPSTPT